MTLFLLPSTLAKLDQPSAQPHPLIIQELDGPRRVITLRGRSLPNEGFAAGVEQRGEIDHYAGNPVGSIQIMGPTFMASTLSGRWDDYHLAEDTSYAKLANFPAVGPAGQTGSRTTGGPSFVSGGAVPVGEARRARTLRDAMFKLAKAGMLLKVQWASIARYGIIKRFEPTHLSDEEITWELEFHWIGDTDATPRPRLLSNTDRLSVIQRTLAAMQAALAAIDSTLAVAFGALVEAQGLLNISRVTSLVTDFLVVAEGVVNIAFTPLDVLGQLKQELSKIKQEAGELKRQARSVSAGYQAVREGRGPAGAAEAEAASRAAVRALLDMAAAADKGIADIEDIEVPEILGFYLTTGQETLRDIALQFGYDDVTGWQVIRDYNGLTSSIVPAGLRILIPRKGATS